MEEALDEEQAPTDRGFTMAQAHAHFDVVMAEEKQGAPLVSVFRRMLREEQQYSCIAAPQAAPARGETDLQRAGERADHRGHCRGVSSIVNEQRTLHECLRSARTMRRARWQLWVNEAERDLVLEKIASEAALAIMGERC